MANLFENWELPIAADMHVHLRDGSMMEAVVPTIRQGGADTVFVMPNLVPPVTTVEAALAYKARIQAIEPNVEYLMSLYLHPSITPETIHAAAKANIKGVKSYPAGVTTNSSSGVVDYESFYPVFAAMEEVDMVLNLHGEAPPDSNASVDQQITVMNAEAAFLPTLHELHRCFPKLRIVLEHCTTAAAIEAVRKCDDHVRGTITAHHLWLTVDDWAGDPINFCKPVAKLPSDRVALLKAATDGSGKFFLGSDSAPHLLSAKKGLTDGGLGAGKCAAGVFTQPNVVGIVLDAFEKAVETGILSQSVMTREMLSNFLSLHGRQFYKVQLPAMDGLKVVRNEAGVNDVVVGQVGKSNDSVVVTFRSGKPGYAVVWK